MAANDYPRVLYGAPVNPDAWYNPIAEAVTALRANSTGSWIPILSASGGTPVLGTGDFLTGKWDRSGLRIFASIDLSIGGAGSSIVGTSWRITLPFNADLSYHVAGVLNAQSDKIGGFQTQSSVSADAKSGSVLLSAAAEIIFYFTGSTSSLGATQLTTGVSGRIKADVSYRVPASTFP